MKHRCPMKRIRLGFLPGARGLGRMILTRCFSTGLAVVLLTASGLAWAREQPPPRTTTPAEAQPRHVQPAKQAQSAQPAQRAPAAGGGGEPSLLGKYDNWRAYAASPGGRKLCFAIAKPNVSRTYPPDLSRSRAYAFVSSRPLDGVKDEVFIIFGFMPAT